MLDIKLIREDVEEVIRRLNTRGGDFSYLRELKAKDERKRELLVVVENLKSERNQKSKQIGEIKFSLDDGKIDVDVTCENDVFEFSITNYGYKTSEEKQKKIFILILLQ